MKNKRKFLNSLLDKLVFSVMSKEPKIALGRIYAVILFFICCYTLISLKLFSVTVVGGLFDVEKDIYYGKIYVPIKRVDIVDRSGDLLATNLVTTSIYANPKFITDPLNTANKLHKIFPVLDRSNLFNKLKSDKSFVWIRRNVIPKEEQLVHDLGIPGLYFETSEKRAYPHGSLLSHIVGYTGLDGEGLSGIERFFNRELKEKAKGRGANKLETIQLSIDTKVQAIIKYELINIMKEFDAVGAIGILQDTSNGELLSVVSLPDYDPHNLNNASQEALFNKATLGSYEVGSVFKIFTMATALDSNVIKLNDVYDVDTALQFSKYKIKDFRGKGGWMSVPEILMYSSNIGISQIALEMGKDRQIRYLKSLGFFSSLDLELHERSFPLYSPFSKWDDLTTVTSSYGHGISVSPLHVVRAMSAVVNGGKLYNPTLIKGKIPEFKQVLKESTSIEMRKLLRMVVKFGSGRKSEVPGMFIGGKTGTSNKVVDGKYRQDLRISSFISAFPIHNPKYVMLISVDEPKGKKETFGFSTGGWVAAPATQRIVEKLIPILNIVPENENKEDIEKALFVKYNPRLEAPDI